MVDNYRWTLDQMISIANLAYIDATSDGKSRDDTFGFYSDMNIGYAGMHPAFDKHLLEQAEQGIGAVGDRGQGTAAGDCEPGDSGGRDGELTAREGDGGGMGHSDILPGVGEGGGEAVQ